MGVRVGPLLSEGSLLSGFIHGHKVLTILSGAYYFRKFTVYNY